jgi:hypothetical protein
MRPDYNKFGVFGARRANVTGWEHESPHVEDLELPKSLKSCNFTSRKGKSTLFDQLAR